MRTLNSRGFWVDTLIQYFQNGEEDSYWVKDYYNMPYGSFIDRFTVGYTPRGAWNTRLYFGYNDFRKTGPGEWSDQDPVPFVPYNGDEEDVTRDNYTQTCEKGFFNGVRMAFSGRAFGMKCSTGNNWIDYTDMDVPEYPDSYTFECPPQTLICGLRKELFLLEDNQGSIRRAHSWSNYHHTYICCPVFHTTHGICGQEGVVLTVMPAKVDCIAVSGTDTKCTTTQTYGRTSGKEMEQGQTTDTSTESSYGYTSTARWERVVSGSASLEVGVEGSAGVPLLASASVSAKATVTVGGQTTDGTEDTKTSSTMDRVSNAFSFKKAVKTEESEEQSTSTEYTILDGQRAIFYDVIKTCGESQIKSEEYVRLLTPSLKCNPVESFEFVFGWRTTTNQGHGTRTFTFSGFGLEIDEDTFTSPLERAINWDIISMGVKEKFTESVVLADENHLAMGGYDFKR